MIRKAKEESGARRGNQGSRGIKAPQEHFRKSITLEWWALGEVAVVSAMERINIWKGTVPTELAIFMEK